MLAQSVGQALTKHMHELLDLMFAYGLSPALEIALTQLGKDIPPLLPEIQGESRFSDLELTVRSRTNSTSNHRTSSQSHLPHPRRRTFRTSRCPSSLQPSSTCTFTGTTRSSPSYSRSRSSRLVQFQRNLPDQSSRYARYFHLCLSNRLSSRALTCLDLGSRHLLGTLARRIHSRSSNSLRRRRQLGYSTRSCSFLLRRTRQRSRCRTDEQQRYSSRQRDSRKAAHPRNCRSR